MPGLSFPLVKLFPVELPPTRIALRKPRETLKLRGVLIRIRLSRELFQVFPHKLIHTRSQDFGTAPRSLNDFVINGKCYVHTTHNTCTQYVCQDLSVRAKFGLLADPV